MPLIGYGQLIGANGPASFAPTDISGLVGWFDMLDAASYTQAGTVTSITNKASGVAWAEATAPPGYSSNGMNGLPCMTFNGTTQKIISTEAAVAAAFTASTANTVLFVAKTTSLSLAAGAAVFGGGVSGGTNLRNINYWAMTGATAKNTYGGATAAGAAFFTLSAANANSNNNVYEWTNTGTAASLSQNGGAKDPNAGAASSAGSSPTRYAIGCIPTVTPQGFWVGNVAEVLLYDSVLSASNLSRARVYLGAKWGITVTP